VGGSGSGVGGSGSGVGGSGSGSGGVGLAPDVVKVKFENYWFTVVLLHCPWHTPCYIQSRLELSQLLKAMTIYVISLLK